MFPQKRDLTADETKRLLEGTPPGVFQAANFVVGPFGLLLSLEARYFAPHLDLLLWHCDDQTCGAIHVCDLSQPDKKTVEAANSIRQELTSNLGPRSAWLAFWGHLVHSDKNYYDDLCLGDLPWFLGNALSASELRLLAEEILRDAGQELRKRFPRHNEFQEALRGSASDIANRLSKPQTLQLLLLATDSQLVASIDKSVEKKAIRIPPTETRYAVYGRPVPSWSGVRCDCSDLGLRVVGVNHTSGPANPQARLKRLILSTYSKDEDKRQLEWILRNAQGATLGEKIENFIGAEAPRVVLERLVFTSQEKLLRSFEHLRAKYFELPQNQEQEKSLVERLLWKLGFPHSIHDPIMQSFNEKLEKLRRTTTNASHSTEEWKERVRSTGVNLFVLLEELLDKALAFATWVFLSDHLEEKHLFNLARGRALMAAQISGILSTDEGPVDYDPAGKNTLYPLVFGFLALKRRLEQLLEEPHDNHLKPQVEMAYFSHESSLQLFPYRHRYFIFDATAADRAKCLTLLEKTTELLERSKLVSIRNRIEHRSDPFPSQDEIRSCCELLNQAIVDLELSGLVPITFTTSVVQADSSGRRKITSVNYAGRQIEWNSSPALIVIPTLPSPNSPQILVPAIRVPDTNEILRFKVQEGSEYSAMWKDFPKWRKPAKGSEHKPGATAASGEIRPSLPEPTSS